MLGKLLKRNQTEDQAKESERSLIDLENVIKAYQTPAGEFLALKGVDMQVDPGSFVAVVGKSGSGKSTLDEHDYRH